MSERSFTTVARASQGIGVPRGSGFRAPLRAHSRRRSTRALTRSCSKRRPTSPGARISSGVHGQIFEAMDGRFDDVRATTSPTQRTTYEDIGEVYAGRNYSRPRARPNRDARGRPDLRSAYILGGCCADASSACTTRPDSRQSPPSSPTPCTCRTGTRKPRTGSTWEKHARCRGRQRAIELATGSAKLLARAGALPAAEAPGPRRPISLPRRTRSATMRTSCSLLPRCCGSLVAAERLQRGSRRRWRLCERKGNLVSADRRERC